MNSPGYKGAPHERGLGTVKDPHQPDKPEAAFMRRCAVALRLHRKVEPASSTGPFFREHMKLQWLARRSTCELSSRISSRQHLTNLSRPEPACLLRRAALQRFQTRHQTLHLGLELGNTRRLFLVLGVQRPDAC